MPDPYERLPTGLPGEMNPKPALRSFMGTGRRRPISGPPELTRKELVTLSFNRIMHQLPNTTGRGGTGIVGRTGSDGPTGL